MPCPHNAVAIAKVLLESLVDFNMDERVSTMTIDNCTDNMK